MKLEQLCCLPKNQAANRNLFLMRSQLVVKPTVVHQRAFTVPGHHQPKQHTTICRYRHLSPEDAQEEHLLLDTSVWPETPHSPTPVDQTSDPAHSTFTILPELGGGQRHVGDHLEALIQVCDFEGHPKNCGGDVLVARLHNPDLHAGVAGRVVDHLNGSYSAVFPLLWEGMAQVEVTLVHPSEAVTVLRRLNREQPDRISFKSLYRSGSVSETSTCNICLPPTEKELCNYTDLHTGDPWFCVKPSRLSCDDRVNHAMGEFKRNIKAQEDKLFRSGVNMKVSIRASGPNIVTALPKENGKPEVSNIMNPGPSGYYYQGVWRALDGRVQQFKNASDVTQCLRGKVLHMFGDSTVRQWFEHLNAALPGFWADRTALHEAASQGRTLQLKELMESGAVVNTVTVDNITPLHESCIQAHPNCARLLLEAGAQVDVRTIHGSTPLCNACAAGSLECAKLLLEYGARVNPSLTALTASPLHEACIPGNADIVRLLIASGAQLEAYDVHFGPPLHIACAKGHLDCVSELLKAGASVNSIRFHETALHLAARADMADMIQQLVDFGANVYASDNLGKKPVDYTTPGSLCAACLQFHEGNPRSLQQLCRIRLRMLLGTRASEVIGQLDISHRIRSYLQHSSHPASLQ
ncbi:uncharacterized protein LOC143013730 isoform X2 [Genypterus blacodes]|uniref:uncharacterized protein LOC143013730 isoform X2 n=1 Tax=Genypterus blacodes TaxID=154954 RepID=UPI003F75F2EB